ncbi:MAG: orotidine-5'-phosphate decarboxylase [Candidatus Micrarchaeia archaeon]
MFETLELNGRKKGTLLCFGIDPVLEKMKCEGGDAKEKIENYYFPIADLLLAENQIVSIKPNYAYFAQYGFEGLHALKSIIERYKGKLEIILDAKRGDIGKSSEAYAKEAFDFWNADALTVSPYMGSDSIKPFLREGKPIYVLCRTSNPGAADFQEKGSPQLYELVAQKALEWKTGLVVGATSDSIKKISSITKGQIPFLIPGIGAQGGDLESVLAAIKQRPHIHRINASSSIAFAWEKGKSAPEKAALEEAKKLNSQIGKIL